MTYRVVYGVTLVVFLAGKLNSPLLLVLEPNLS